MSLPLLQKKKKKKNPASAVVASTPRAIKLAL